MPNWCNNRLMIYGPEAEIKRFKETATGYSPWSANEEQKRSVLNFDSLLPIPPEILAAGYEAGYEWELKHWGCKWGAETPELVEGWEGHLEYAFATAWSPPVPLLAKLGPQWPSLTFVLDYDELGVGFKGIAKIRDEDVIDHCIEL